MFDGAVLAGGASRRMGTDKAFVEVDGVAMVRRVVTALEKAGASRVVCVGGDRTRLEAVGLDGVDDERPGEGPLAGLVTALGWSDAPAVVVAGCDQPWLTAATIVGLVRAHVAGEGPVSVYRVGDRWQPLPGVYDVALRPLLVEALAGGERALGTALRLVTPTVLSSDDPAQLRDVDRPEDLGPR